MADEVEPVVVTAVAVSANGNIGRENARRIERAMADEVLRCNEEGISTSEENSDVIRGRVLAARQRELRKIAAEAQGS